ncbi:MAG: hypothetical protein IID15_07500 [Candidatus Marinimicrobia bacterium]|nr:hypothetical protein [Candidatus Neomarinimicrobiota bacterium]
MNLGEKLNLLWKYLLLLILAWGVYSYTQNRQHSFGGHGKMQGMHGMNMMGDHGNMTSHGGGDMTRVLIKKEIVDGDTIMTVIVNGEEIEVEKMLMEDGQHVFITKDGKTIKLGGGKGERMQMRHRKKMKDGSDNSNDM